MTNQRGMTSHCEILSSWTFGRLKERHPLSIPNKEVNRHPPVGNEFHDTRIRKYPDGPQSEDESPRLPTKVSFKGDSHPVA